MHVAIASYNTPNHEGAKVRELFPQYLQESAANLISFMEQYYEYMNQEGAPSYELEHLMSEGDIDNTSAKYLDAIQSELAKIVPNSSVMDRNTLYKRIVHYYRIKGTPESAEVFFRMMFDTFVEIYYPSNDLFKLSSGNYDSSARAWVGRSGFLSSTDKIQDSEFWQDFSYQLKTEIPSSKWSDEYTRMVHPAGMKFFVITSVVGKALSLWNQPIDYTDDDWMKYLKPPWLKTSGYSNGFHSPKYQPGWLNTLVAQEIIALADNYFTSSSQPNASSLTRAISILRKLYPQSTNFRAQYVHNSFFLGENGNYPIFWNDPRTLANFGYMDSTIESLIAEYTPSGANLSNPYGSVIDTFVISP